jgi:cyclase
MATLHGEPERFEGGLREIAPGVHAWLTPNGSWGETNAALVVGEGESLLVETLWTVPMTRRMLDAMEPLSAEAPIRRLVNTHADGDHWWGNQLVAGAEIVATRAAAEEMSAMTPGRMASFKRLARALGAGARLRLPGGELGRYVSRMLAPFDFSGIDLTPPTRTFEGSLTLDVGGRAVELIEVGPAHTGGDAIVHVPDASTVLAADILFSGLTPVMWAGPPERWIAALERIEELAPDVVLPGHGPPSTLAEVRELRGYFELVARAGRERLGAGDSTDDAAVAIVESEEFRAGPWASWPLPERLAVTLRTMAGTAGNPLATFAEVAKVACRLAATPV